MHIRGLAPAKKAGVQALDRPGPRGRGASGAAL